MPPPSKASTQKVHAQLKAGNEENPHSQKRSKTDLLKSPSVLGHGPRTYQGALKEGFQVSGPPPKPITGPMAVATEPEWGIYWALTQRLRKVDGVDFVYRRTAGLLASLSERTQLDFMMLDGSQIAIEVQGIYWHYGQGGKKIADDLVRAGLLSGRWNIVDIDEDDALRDPEHYTREALQGHDHSYRYKGFFNKPRRML